MRILAAAALCLSIFLASPAPARERQTNEAARLAAENAVAARLTHYRTQVHDPDGTLVDLKPALTRIAAHRSLKDAGLPFHAGDGTIFLNLRDRGTGRPPLPARPKGYYFEYVVPPQPGTRFPGPRRLLIGSKGEAYYSPQHYDPRSIVDLSGGVR